MLIIGHRGAKGYAPENTISSFKRAIELGVDMIELDVYVLLTGEVVLMHDHKVDRTTNGKGYVYEQSYDEVRALDAGGGEQVPTLQEVLDFVNRRVVINVELKGPGTAKAVAAIIADYIETKGWQPSNFIVSSFNHHELKEFQSHLPSITIAALMDALPLDYAAFAERLGAKIVSPGHQFVTKEYVDDAHARGMRVNVWTVDDPDEIHRMMRMGIDGIFTNVPDIARAAVQTYREVQTQTTTA